MLISYFNMFYWSTNPRRMKGDSASLIIDLILMITNIDIRGVRFNNKVMIRSLERVKDTG